MSILYIEDKLKEKENQKKIIKALSEIGLEPEDLPELMKKKDTLMNKEDTLMEYQEWVKERFFQEYELNNNKVITPKFGDEKET